MSTLKKIVTGVDGPTTALTQFTTEVGNEILGRELITNDLAISTEGMSDVERQSLINTAMEIRTTVESVAADLGFEDLTDAQKASAVYGGLIAADPQAFLNSKIKQPASSDSSVTVVNNTGVLDAYDQRTISVEAYDERENKEASIYSVTYNMQAPRQDDFGEAFFPTVACSPDEVGFGVHVELTMVYSDLQKKTTGKIYDFKKKNILRAIADPDILHDELTRLIPVYRSTGSGANTDNFVDVSLMGMAATNIVRDGKTETDLTTYLKPGARFDLLGISQTDALLAKGTMDETDTIDPGVVLENIAIQTVGTGGAPAVFKFPVEDLPSANFVYSAQGNYRKMVLNFQTTSILIEEGKTKLADGNVATSTNTGLNTFTPTQIASFRLRVVMTGELDIETGETVVWANEVSIDSARDPNGELVDLTTGDGAQLVSEFNAGTDGLITGYTLKAFATNANRRNRGQILDVTRYTTLYNIPVRNSITAIHPVSGRYDNDTSDLAALISATRVRASNAAVETLIRAGDVLKSYTSAGTVALDANGNPPEILGTGRFLVQPTYYEQSIDMSSVVDSLRSAKRAEDIQHALVNYIRDYAYQMYRDSEYKAAYEAMHGGVNKIPTVIVGTDPVIGRYLTVTGDSRTLGNGFDMKVVTTLNKNMKGKIFITFGVYDGTRNQKPNVLNFGNMGWCPEIPVVLPISRGGQVSKELAVSPRFLHCVHLPILTKLTVTNIQTVLGKVTQNEHAV